MSKKQNETADFDELIAILKFFIDHNSHHVEEILTLATAVKAHNPAAYNHLLLAATSFEKGNEYLEKSLKELTK